MVPMEGLEPSRVIPTDFESVVSTNSTTSALLPSQKGDGIITKNLKI